MLPQNFFLGGKDKLIGAALIEGNNTPATSHISTPTAAIAPVVVFALFSVTQYLKNDF